MFFKYFFLEDSKNEQSIIVATTFYRFSDLVCINRSFIVDSRITRGNFFYLGNEQ